MIQSAKLFTVLLLTFASTAALAAGTATHVVDSTWRQDLKCSDVNGVLYFDEGNGEQVPRREVGGN